MSTPSIASRVAGPRRRLRVASLFSGVAGFELGLRRSGHEILAFCESDPAARSVLGAHFPEIPIFEDVRAMDELPSGTELVTAGFPCQDLSSVGRRSGIFGKKSSLVWEVFRLLDRSRPEWVLLENVPFMLRLGKGLAIEALVAAFEERGYRWAYRTLDPRVFGLPQRRPRVFLLAGRTASPCNVLFAALPAIAPSPERSEAQRCFGFYWTEGNRGIGWAEDATPALKGGSSLGIPSPPAIVMDDESVVTPHIADAERLQGFPARWTVAGAINGRIGHRWRLVGNAVNVRVAAWIGAQLAMPGRFVDEKRPLRSPPWPTSAYGDTSGRFNGPRDTFVHESGPSLRKFLLHRSAPLSHKAAAGVLGRLKASSLRVPQLLLRALEGHVREIQQRDSAPPLQSVRQPVRRLRAPKHARPANLRS